MPSVTSARVLQALESAILSGQFKPRERLVEMDLIARFGVSRTLIREAFNKLEAKGLLRATPYRGVAVADVTVRQIEEIYFVRVALEKIAARLVAENSGAEEIRFLKKMNEDVEAHLRRKTPQMIEKDWAFHRAIFQTCQNRYLFEIIDDLRTKAFIVAYNAWSMPQRIEQSILEHRQMIRAIAKRDRIGLERLIVKHLTFSKNSYLAQLKGGDLEKAPRSVQPAPKPRAQSGARVRRKHLGRRRVA
jgi:DNA-binding GntR family transcriptional regulator